MRRKPEIYNNVRYIRRRKRNAAPVFGLWLFLLFSCLVSSYFFMHSAFFSLRHIHVQGTISLKPESIIEQSGLKPGSNLFKLDTQGAALKTELDPTVKSVKIERKLPDAVVIKIVERTPTALVAGGEGLIIVDDEGIFIKAAEPGASNLPLVSGVPIPENARPGSDLSTPGLRAALSLIGLLDKAFLTGVVEIVAPTPESLTLKTRQGVEIRFGKPEDLERKIKVMEKLLVENKETINAQTVEYIDLRYDTAPVIKRKN